MSEACSKRYSVTSAIGHKPRKYTDSACLFGPKIKQTETRTYALKCVEHEFTEAKSFTKEKLEEYIQKANLPCEDDE